MNDLPASLVRTVTARLVAVLVLSCGSAAWAQSTSPNTRFGELQSNVPGTYYHAEPGEETVQVIVWGTIANRGRYRIPTGTTLGELIALAGGPVLQARSRNTGREVTITVSRKQPPGREVVYTLEGSELINTDQRYPVLQDRDIVQVEMVEWQEITFRDVVSVLGSLASLALIADRVIRY